MLEQKMGVPYSFTRTFLRYSVEAGFFRISRFRDGWKISYERDTGPYRSLE